MRCMNCGLPLSPSRTLTNCPRCGAPVNAFQGGSQAGWDAGMGGGGQMGQQNPWGQSGPSAQSPFSPFPQQNQESPGASRAGTFSGNLPPAPMAPRRPNNANQKSKGNPRVLFIVATLFIVMAAVLLGVIYVLASANGGGTSPGTASTGSNTSTTPTATPTTAPAATATDTPDPGATATGTAYPGQQYIDGAQMAAGVNKSNLTPTNPTTTFKVGSQMYVVFNLHPPSAGGAVCSYWYLGGKQVTSYPFAVKGTQKASYTYATYGSAGDAYVELYWASTKDCTDQVLAQRVDFTVTA